jgi:hypothetical protein
MNRLHGLPTKRKVHVVYQGDPQPLNTGPGWKALEHALAAIVDVEGRLEHHIRFQKGYDAISRVIARCMYQSSCGCSNR